MTVFISLIMMFSILYLLKSKFYEAIIGVLLLGNGINLTIIALSNPKLNLFPFVSGTSVNDPIPQALVLTAIVIGFAFLAFLIALVKRATRHNAAMEISDMLEEE